MFVALVISTGSLFYRVKVCRKEEYWCDEVFASGIDMELSLVNLLLCGRILGVIRAFGNSVIFLTILSKWHSFYCAHLVLNEGIFAAFKRP